MNSALTVCCQCNTTFDVNALRTQYHSLFAEMEDGSREADLSDLEEAIYFENTCPDCLT